MKFIDNLTEGLLIASGLLVPFISLVVVLQIIKGILVVDTILRVFP